MAPSPRRSRNRAILAFAAALIAVCAAPGADDATKSFDLPAGDAGEALKQFVQQAGSEIMFLSGSLDGVTTPAVKGNLTAREALNRMVAGTDLAVTQDGRSGAFAIARKVPSDPVIRLPPYLVMDSPPVKWQYVALPGFEILSCCRTIETEGFVDEIYRQQAWLDEIVPPYLQVRETVPTTMILFSADIKKAISESVARLAAANAARVRLTLAEAGVPVLPPASDLMPQIKLWDEDSTGVDIVLKDSMPGRYRDIGFSPDHIFFLLARQVPPLPPWFIDGVLSLYQTRFADAQVGSLRIPMSGVIGVRGGMSMGGLFEPQRSLRTHQYFSPVFWISPEITHAVRDDDSAPRTLLPMREFLAGPIPPAGSEEDKSEWLAKFGLGAPADRSPARILSPAQARLILRRGAERDSPWRRDLWMSQALLFVRWALDDGTYERRKDLWKFVSRTSVEPVTEAAFKDCFGLGFDEVRRRLDAYLPKALKTGLALIPETPLEIPWIELRDPTEAQEARILGDWQRKEFEFVRASHPEYADSYARQANRTFRRAYDDGARDPDFLAALGIYECTVGDDARAADFLAAAVRAGVARPRAYVELARIHYDEALAKPGGAGGRLDSRQVASVIDLLQASRTQLPPQFAAYAQAAEAWEHAAAAPTSADLLMLDEGLRFFPNNSRLMLATARLRARIQPR